MVAVGSMLFFSEFVQCFFCFQIVAQTLPEFILQDYDNACN